MKKIFLYISVIVFALYSCEDFITLQPEDTINEGMFYKTSGDYETALIGVYSGIQDLHGGSSLMYIAELMSDNHTIYWQSPTANEMECNEKRITSSNGFVSAVWSNCFTSISRCNGILMRIDGADFSDELKTQYKGEALFLRAYSYFYLVRLFGDLPLIKVAFRSPDEIASYDMSRKPVNEVYQLIIQDLEAADSLLTDVEGLSKSRASSGAAKTLLGKVYLTRKEYSLASAILDEVMVMDYHLVLDYSKMFTVNNDELTESIFEIKFLSGQVGEGNSYSTIFTPGIFNMNIFPGGMVGHGSIVPTKDLAYSFEKGDLRRAATLMDSVKLLTGAYQKQLCGLKFVDFTVGISGDGGTNFTALRYADVLLMKSEALNELGFVADGDAFDLLNTIRTRAGLPEKTSTNPVDSLRITNQAEFRLAMEDERRSEFAYEQQRWFDLVRTGRALTVINAFFQKWGQNFDLKETELLMPIPQRERDIDPDLEPNPGY